MSGDLSQVEDRIKQTIKRRVRPNLDVDRLTSATPLIKDGLGLDSAMALELVIGLEEEFDIVIDDSELSADLFGTLSTLTRFVAGKLG